MNKLPFSVNDYIELKKRYGITNNGYLRIKIDKNRVPQQLHKLIPFVEFFILTETSLRKSFLDQLPLVCFEELNIFMNFFDDELDKWLNNTNNNTLEYIAFTDLRLISFEFTQSQHAWRDRINKESEKSITNKLAIKHYLELDKKYNVYTDFEKRRTIDIQKYPVRFNIIIPFIIYYNFYDKIVQKKVLSEMGYLAAREDIEIIFQFFDDDIREWLLNNKDNKTKNESLALMNLKKVHEGLIQDAW